MSSPPPNRYPLKLVKISLAPKSSLLVERARHLSLPYKNLLDMFPYYLERQQGPVCPSGQRFQMVPKIVRFERNPRLGSEEMAKLTVRS
jgi:hypothetical protein